MRTKERMINGHLNELEALAARMNDVRSSPILPTAIGGWVAQMNFHLKGLREITGVKKLDGIPIVPQEG